MQLPKPPSGFDRATGTVEGRRQCNDCGDLYPVTDHEAQPKCPKCGSANTEKVEVGK